MIRTVASKTMRTEDARKIWLLHIRSIRVSRSFVSYAKGPCYQDIVSWSSPGTSSELLSKREKADPDNIVSDCYCQGVNMLTWTLQLHYLLSQMPDNDFSRYSFKSLYVLKNFA